MKYVKRRRWISQWLKKKVWSFATHQRGRGADSYTSHLQTLLKWNCQQRPPLRFWSQNHLSGIQLYFTLYEIQTSRAIHKIFILLCLKCGHRSLWKCHKFGCISGLSSLSQTTWKSWSLWLHHVPTPHPCPTTTTTTTSVPSPVYLSSRRSCRLNPLGLEATGRRASDEKRCMWSDSGFDKKPPKYLGFLSLRINYSKTKNKKKLGCQNISAARSESESDDPSGIIIQSHRKTFRWVCYIIFKWIYWSWRIWSAAWNRLLVNRVLKQSMPKWSALLNDDHPQLVWGLKETNMISATWS